MYLFKALFFLLFSKEHFGKHAKQIMGSTYDDERRDLEVKGLRGAFWSSLLMTVIIVLLVVSIGFAVGKLDVQAQIKWVSVFNFTGAAFTGWATLFGLGNKFDTYSGEAIGDLLPPFIFKVIFAPGLVCLLLGAIG
ncbi:hypothetical protein NOK74_24080 [Vibrio parahaemolyticus]|uniref:hypothetical protein n=1 Tax=Vibrio parahaemolyticus TaxID=670 RepID=UPI00226A24EA|nr:hypothetical protein [Vibrio parahaemolyticus]MCX8875284.1 hypothetical protein [Vibrio parahaemolyticus]